MYRILNLVKFKGNINLIADKTFQKVSSIVENWKPTFTL